MTGDYFVGTFRQTYQGQDLSNPTVPFFFLETAGFGCTPLMFHTRDGIWIRPVSQLDAYDEGSVPHGIAQGVVSPNAWSCAYVFHDCAYVNHGWFEWNPTASIWEFKEKTRDEADRMLQRGMVALGCSFLESYTALEFVRLGGGGVWDSHMGPFPIGPFLQSSFPPADVLSARVPIWKEVGDILKKET